MNEPSVTAGRGWLGSCSGVAIKIQSKEYELNIFLVDDEIAILDTDLPTGPDERALTAGSCCGVPVHWAQDSSDHLYILVGGDDETWDIGFTLPIEAFGAILTEIQALPEA